MRHYAKLYFKDGVFFLTDPGNMRLASAGGSDMVTAVTMFGGSLDPNETLHHKYNLSLFLNQIIPLVGTDQGAAIAISYFGFWDYGEYHAARPNG